MANNQVDSHTLTTITISISSSINKYSRHERLQRIDWSIQLRLRPYSHITPPSGTRTLLERPDGTSKMRRRKVTCYAPTSPSQLYQVQRQVLRMVQEGTSKPRKHRPARALPLSLALIDAALRKKLIASLYPARVQMNSEALITKMTTQRIWPRRVCPPDSHRLSLRSPTSRTEGHPAPKNTLHRRPRSADNANQ